MSSGTFACATIVRAAGLKTPLPPVWSAWWCVSSTTSISRSPRPGSPARQTAAESRNCVSTTISASGFDSQPMVPPRPVKSPTLRRSGRNTGVHLAMGPAGVFTGTVGAVAGVSANRDERAKRPAEASNDERRMKSRRFMPGWLTANGRE